MRFVVACICLSGCSFSTQLTPGGDDMPPEAGTTTTDGKSIDAQTLDGCTTFSTVLDTCGVGAYGTGISINGMRKYDTDTHVLSDDNGQNASTPAFRDVTVGTSTVTVLVVEGFTIQMQSRLRVVGARAFGVVSSGTISIVGTIDATAGGAGARTAAICAASAGGGGTNGNDGAGGGGGGGYRGDGGVGGKGDTNGTPRNGGDKGQKITLGATIIGGCPGGKGGNNGGGTQGGAGGAGGGAVFLTSAQAMTITGIINVGGGGGIKGLAVDGGGGGGGSGGLVLLESTPLTVTGIIAANGGSGAGGAGGLAGTDGNTGVAAASAAPPGVTQSSGGSSGSPGAAGGNLDGIQPSDAGGGAGGAGGGVGFVSIKTTSALGGIISPSPSAWPF